MSKIKFIDDDGNVQTLEHVFGEFILRGSGPATLGHNRERTGLATTYAENTNSVIWTADLNIKQAICLVTAANAVPGVDYIKVAQNADDATTAGNWLASHGAATDGQSEDVHFDKFSPGEIFIIDSETPIERLDFLPVDVTGTVTGWHLLVGAH